MTPYHPTSLTARLLLFLLIFGLFCPNSAPASDQVRVLDAVSRSGFQHFYSLEYDQAIADFQKGIRDNPDDPNRVNYLMEAILFRELYKYNALDTRMYTHQRFIAAQLVPMDPAIKKQIKDLADKAIGMCDQHLKANPNDVQALYSRGVTEGLRSTYLAIVEHAWFAALRNALAARRDHEAVLKAQPNFADAKTIVGAHNYVVGSLSTPVKVMAGITGIHGDRKKGLEYLMEAGKAGGESNADARVTLGVFLRREERWQDGLDNLRTLIHDYPHNFLFALEEGHLLQDAGRHAEAAAVYQKLITACRTTSWYPNARVLMVQYALGDALRSQNKYAEALPPYQEAASAGNNDRQLRQRALLASGEVEDLLSKRDQALTSYNAAIALDSSTEEAATARKLLKKPFNGQE